MQPDEIQLWMMTFDESWSSQGLMRRTPFVMLK